MPYLFFLLFLAGGAPAAVLGVGVRSEDSRIARASRIAFALLLGVDLLLAAAVFAVDTSNADSSLNATRSLWWATLVLGCFPLVLASGLAVRRGYLGHRLALVVALVSTAILYLAFPFGFVPAGQPLSGLGRLEHDHQVLDIAILFIPSLILLTSELLRNEDVALPESDRSSPGNHLAPKERRRLIGGGVLLLAFLVLAATSSSGLLLGLGVLLAGSGLFLWSKHRSTMRRVRRDLGSSNKS